MVVIFGWGEGEAKDLGEVAPVTCPNCHNEVFLHLITSTKRVSLYFVPLAQYGSNEYLACPICRHGLQLAPGQRQAADQMRAATSMFRRGAVPQDYYLATVEAFWAKLGVAPSGQQVLRPAPTVPPPLSGEAAAPTAGPSGPSGPSPSLAGQLEGLAQLHAEGVLTDDEFAAAKRRLLGG